MAFVGSNAFAQVNYSQDWTATGLNGWNSVSGGTDFSRNTTAAQICGSAGGTIRTEQYYGSNGQFTSPVLSGNNQGLITMTFDYKITKYGASTTGQTLASLGNIKVQYAASTAGPWTTAYTIDNTNHTVGATCVPKTVTFTPDGGNLYVRFNVTANSSADTYYYFDNVNITQGAGVSCITPSGLNVTNISTNSAGVSWVGLSTAPTNGYQVYYSTSNTAPTSTTLLDASNSVNSTSTTATISNLNPATVYYAWLRAVCSTTDQSSWSQFISFTTACNAMNVPYVQDFESVTPPNMPVCTTLQNAGSGNNWATSSDPSFSGTFSGNFLTYNYNSANAANTWFYLPGLNLLAGQAYNISYKYLAGSGFPEKFKVAVGTSAISSAMTNVLADYPNVSNSSPNNVTISFTPTADGVYYFGFNCYSAKDMYYLSIDDISVNAATNLATNETATNKGNSKISPNPFSDYIQISEIEKVKSISVMDTSGKLVKTVDKLDSRINLSELNSGMYIVVLTMKDGTKQSIKAIKK